jgi:HEAT repeat protein
MTTILWMLAVIPAALGGDPAAKVMPKRADGLLVFRFQLQIGENISPLGEPPDSIDFKKIPAWIEAVKGKDDTARREAARMLGFAGEKGKVAVPALVEMLKDPNPENRATAANALGNLGPVAKEAVPDLMQALKDDEILWMVLYAFIWIGPDAKQAIPALVEGLDRFPGSCKSGGVSSVTALAAMGPEAFPALAKELGCPQAKRRASAAAALGSYEFSQSPRIKEVIPDLIALTRDQDTTVCCWAVCALGEIHQEAGKVVPALIRCLDDKREADIRWKAAHALGQFGQRARPAIPQLLLKLQDPEHFVRWCSALALGEIGPGKDAVPALIRALDDQWAYMGAITALGRIGPGAKEAVPALLKALDKAESSDAHWIKEALDKIDPEAIRKARGPGP